MSVQSVVGLGLDSIRLRNMGWVVAGGWIILFRLWLDDDFNWLRDLQRQKNIEHIQSRSIVYYIIKCHKE